MTSRFLRTSLRRYRTCFLKHNKIDYDCSVQAHEALVEEREVQARLKRSKEAREKADMVF